MRVLLDLNVLLDYLERRDPFFEDAARLVDAIHYRKVHPVIAGHAVTTLEYIMSKTVPPQRVKETLRWLVDTFEIAPPTAICIQNALDSPMTDFEDAVTAYCALSVRCEVIITRDVKGFELSPVRQITPQEFSREFELQLPGN